MPTGLVYDERFLRHDTGPGHPERPQRLTAVMEGLGSRHLIERMERVAFGPAPLEWIHRVHRPEYVARLKAACEMGERTIDESDSAICPESYDIALLAAGGVVAAAEAVVSGKLRNAFCAVRPPGHHAENDRSMGFCLFNNVAVAAAHLIEARGLQRVVILDWDVHHGNGTQHIFEARRDIFFVSLHEHPLHLYPGTGYFHEAGVGHGEGYTLNLPLSPGAGDAEFRKLFLSRVIPAIEKHRPDVIFISAGFDACRGDPLAHLEVTPQGFQWMTRQLKATAELMCGGRLISVLEGGYNLKNLSECAALHVEALLEPEGHDGMMGMKAGL